MRQPSLGGRPPITPARPAGRQLGETEVKRLNRSWRRATQARVCLLLESVSQPFNLGSIIRTAAAFGVEHIWLCGEVADPMHPSARKTSLGTGRYVSFEQVASPAAAADEIRTAGMRLVVIEQAASAVPLHEAAVYGDVCLAFGHEDRGCSPALLGVADQVAYIPQVGRVGSLNVAAAAAIALAEARRREWSPVVGDAVVGDAVVGDAVVGDAVVGDAVTGDTAEGDHVDGRSADRADRADRLS